MPILLNPYLSFRDTTRQAMEFYRSVFGGELTMNTFKEYNASPDPGENNKIMHSMLQTDNGIIIMAADTPNRMEYKPGNSMAISLSGDNEPELRGYWEKLVTGGTIREPLRPAPWGNTFGMLTDKFGVEWLINIANQPAPQ